MMEPTNFSVIRELADFLHQGKLTIKSGLSSGASFSCCLSMVTIGMSFTTFEDWTRRRAASDVPYSQMFQGQGNDLFKDWLLEHLCEFGVPKLIRDYIQEDSTITVEQGCLCIHCSTDDLLKLCDWFVKPAVKDIIVKIRFGSHVVILNSTEKAQMSVER